LILQLEEDLDLSDLFHLERRKHYKVRITKDRYVEEEINKRLEMLKRYWDVEQITYDYSGEILTASPNNEPGTSINHLIEDTQEKDASTLEENIIKETELESVGIKTITRYEDQSDYRKEAIAVGPGE
jgi:tRNA/tmRNA/rRNA uracil-C5-methylase (TrmA/RlmC/RlmD family)